MNTYTDSIRTKTSSQKPSASERTKLRIANAFEELLSEKSFGKITVQDIADRCVISRQTFYNHFLDKFDLSIWIYHQLLTRTTRRIGIDMTWEQAVRAKLEAMKEKKGFYSELFKQNDINGLLNAEADIVYDYYVDNLYRMVGKELNSFESYVLMIYCVGATRMTAEWIKSGATLSVDSIIAADKVSMPAFARNVFLG
ncbi:MAG: TetR family transcriptional regulator [Eggerthellales bacterium]|nr:TetR family transcriptional regulator [Eggerthellales bacterium]